MSNIRSRVEVWDWFRGAAENRYTYNGNLVRISFSQQTKWLDWQFELAAPLLFGVPKDSVGPALKASSDRVPATTPPAEFLRIRPWYSPFVD